MGGARLWLVAASVWCCGVVVAGTLQGGRGQSAGAWAAHLIEGRADAAPAFRPSTQVVLFTPDASDPLVARLEAELAAVGIAVRRISLPSNQQLDAVVTREIAAGASAAIRIIPRSRGTEVWTGDTTARVLSRRSARGDVSDAVLSVIALRTVEFLRASLLDVKRRGAGIAASSAGRPNPDPGAGREGGTDERGPLSIDRQGGGQAAAGEGGGSSAAAPAGPVSVEIFPTRAPGAGTRGDGIGSGAGRPSPSRAGERSARALPGEPDVGSHGRRVDQPATEPRRTGDEPPPRSADGNGDRGSDVQATAPAGPYVIDAGPATLASPGGIAPIPAVAAMGGGPIVGRLGWEMLAVFPVAPVRVTNASGFVDIKAALFGAGATFRLVPGDTWIADGALGVSATMLRSAGTGAGSAGSIPNTGYTVSSWKPGLHVRVGAGYRLNRWLTLRADAIGGAVASRTRIENLVTDSNGNTVADRTGAFGAWGPLFGGGILGLQATW